jgi:hypothetical protein
MKDNNMAAVRNIFLAVSLMAVSDERITAVRHAEFGP